MFRCSRHSLRVLECLALVLFLLENSETATSFPLFTRRFAPPRHHIRRHDVTRTKSSRISSTPYISEDLLPYQVIVSRNLQSWIPEAVETLRRNGVCALVSSFTTSMTLTNNNSIIQHSDCDRANEAAASRLSELQRRIRNRGIDPTDGPFRFQEVVCRDERRYDMPVPWKGAGDVGTPMTEDQSNDTGNLHARINDIVQPVINDLWSHDSSHVAAAGFLTYEPGSSSQEWHRDGPEEGSIDVFCPLIPLTELVGPTEVWPGTHTATQTDDDNFENNSPKIIPLLQKGQILLFDYRTLHRGLGNKSDSTTRTLAYAVYKRGSSSMGDIRNFPDALTLEYD